VRSIVHYRDLAELDARNFLGIDIAGYDLLHFEGRNIEALAVMMDDARTRAPALPISLELEKPRPGMEALFGIPDLLICSRGFSLHHGHEAPQDFLHWMSGCAPQATVVVAWGEAGAFGLVPGGPVCHAPGSELTEVVDTLGAGDTFNAGMLDAITRSFPLNLALAHACTLAGRKCGVHGFDI